MDNLTQTSNQKITSFYVRKNKHKYTTKILDKASRLFESNVALKYGYKIIKFIDVKGLRIVIAEDGNNALYAISLIITQGMHNANNQLTLSEIGSITKQIGYENNAIAGSYFVT